MAAADALREVAAGEAEKALEGGHWRSSAVEAELELAEVGGNILGAHAVVGSSKRGWVFGVNPIGTFQNLRYARFRGPAEGRELIWPTKMQRGTTGCRKPRPSAWTMRPTLPGAQRGVRGSSATGMLLSFIPPSALAPDAAPAFLYCPATLRSALARSRPPQARRACR